MSTKIWTAYVMRDKRQLWPVCRKIRLKCEAEVRKILVEQYTYNVEDAKGTLGKEDDPYKKYRYTDGGELTPWCASRFVHDKFGETMTKHMLILEIVSYNGWFEICPAFEMSREKANAT